ncbi:MAG: ABC-2 family transporter protein [Thermoclostridium sp.]|nr:ABC-2 family transporter protein [Thermoclostridium sp.]
MAGKRLKQLLRLYGLYAKMDLAWLMRDTKFFLLAVIADFLSNIAAVTGVFLLAWRFNGVGGMDKYEVLFMLGYVTTCTGIFQTFFANSNTGHISRRIGRGQMEHMLIQPLPLPIQLITEGFIPVSGSSNLISGAIIIGVAVKNLGFQPSLGWVSLLLLHLITTILILLFLSYLFSSAAFYAPVQAEEISSHVLDSTGILSTYPLSGMALVIQIPLITIIPAGLLGWFPTLALLGKPPLGFPSFYPMLMAAFLYILAYIAFTKGLKHYVKTGTNRYSAVGHRR